MFLVADATERARRRSAERPGRRRSTTLAADLRERDERDAVNTQPADDAVLLDTTELTIDEVVERIVELVRRRGGEQDGRDLGGRPARRSGRRPSSPRRLRVYGAERVPLEGGLVVAVEPLQLDRPAGARRCDARGRSTSWRRSRPIACPGLGQLMRSFGAFSVRRGESDRDAVRTMREIVRLGPRARAVRRGDAPALRRPGPGAAGCGDGRDQRGRVRSAAPRSTARTSGGSATSSRSPSPGASPMTFDGLPRGGKGYKEASVEIEREIRTLWEWLAQVHELGRPRDATPPSDDGRRTRRTTSRSREPSRSSASRTSASRR